MCGCDGSRVCVSARALSIRHFILCVKETRTCVTRQRDDRQACEGEQEQVTWCRKAAQVTFWLFDLLKLSS